MSSRRGKGTSYYFVIVLLHVAMATQDRWCTIEDTKNNVGWCNNFGDILSLVCGEDGYNGPNDKRSLGGDQDEDPASLLNGYQLTKSAALSYFHPENKRIAKRDVECITVNGRHMCRGPMCECCHNQCQYFEMISYCKNQQSALENLNVIA